MRKSSIRICFFMVILVIVLVTTNKIFKVKYGDGIYGLTKFYELENNSIDVLCLGSSHAFQNINTGTLWDEYGIASFDLCGSIQPLWNTYYYLKEALKTQKPELIVLEGYTTTFSKEYSDDSRIIKNTFGMHWSKDKLDAIKVSAPEERWYEFILEYEQYHTRYRELSDADFLANQNKKLYKDWKGFGCAMVTVPQETIDISNVTGRVPLYEKTEEYFRKILELAQEEDIPIIVIISPYAGITEDEQMIYNTVSDIAAEYDIPFANFNYDYEEIGIDYSTDAQDYGHLNYKGNQKYSKYLGKYLKERFHISDRREDLKYDSWQRNADYLRQMYWNQELVEAEDVEMILSQLGNENYWVFISVDGNCTTAEEETGDFLERLGIKEKDKRGIWIRQNNEVVWDSITADSDFYLRLPTHDFCARNTSDESKQLNNEIIIDNVQHKKVTNGVNITVYDTVTDTVIDSFGLNMDNEYVVTR